MSQPPPPEPPPAAPPGPPRGEEEEDGESRPIGPVFRLGSTQCQRCLITFPDAAYALRHAKREHPQDFVRAALRGAQFVCFVCGRPFPSSRDLLRHQRSHGPPAPPAYACTECGRAFAREAALHRHYIQHARGEL